MEESPREQSRIKNWAALLLKILITGLCLWYVSGKIDFQKAGAALQKADWFWLVPALAAFILSKWIAAIRLNLYFTCTGLRLSGWQNTRLYWLGMFYNLFLPGSISGDAYKVFLLKKKFNAPYKKSTAAVLTDRISGLLGLGLIGAVYSILVLENSLYAAGICCTVLAATGFFYFITRKWFPGFIPVFFRTLLLGTAVQAAQVVCVYLLMKALRIPAHSTEYIFIFLVSSVVSVLPLTIGGLGIRELVFLEGSALFGLAQESSVVISLLFYLVTLLTSAAGAWFIFHDPLAEKNKGPLLSP